MISRVRLLSGLDEIIYVEEGMLTTLSSFSKAMVEHTDELEEEKKQKILGMLSRLYNDSARHKEMVNALIEKVEGSGKDEY